MRRTNTSWTPWPRSPLVLLLAILLQLTLAVGAFAIGEPIVANPDEEVIGEPAPAPSPLCSRTLTANVVALDQPYFWNRLGAVQPHGMMYALERDVVAISGSIPGAGNAQLRETKRPRPLVLRMNVGDCLRVRFKNWLASSPVDEEQVATRAASLHVTGMQLVNSIADDGSYVGKNASSLAASGGTRFYTFYAEREGTFLLHSNGALHGGEGDNGTISAGLFGAVNVEPRNSVWYRSQVTRQELDWATQQSSGVAVLTAGGHPILNYAATYPVGHPFAGDPILAMLRGTEIIHSDLTAIISGTGTNSTITPNPYPQIGTASERYTLDVLPNRNEPFREFTIIFHDEIAAVQAFPEFNHAVLNHTLHSVRDAFAINYGTGGIGAEILANRIGVGPMAECTECLYEEFFLSAWAVGDPAMVVDVPANAPCTPDQLGVKWDDTSRVPCAPTPGFKATMAFYPDDPSNVYHSYLNDHVKFRNLLAGSDDHHIFHLHAHQWLHTPDADNSTYLDSQAIGQGTSFTYEIAHGGSGNANKTPGDSIFHCHFYPHFAQGMWAMWRVHDVFERGTQIGADGKPIHFATAPVGSPVTIITNTRALPDAEIKVGTPIPAIVPLPGQAMAPMPQVTVQIRNGQVWVDPTGSGNPGYPFYVPAVAGHRPPMPPLDFYNDGVNVHDGGLPRHIITGGTFFEEHTRLSFLKKVLTADATELASGGERWEKEAMKFHADSVDGVRDGKLASFRPNGSAAQFDVNGSDPIAGAPYADPCFQVTTPVANRTINYKAANIQLDVVFNKEGWHFPQQRIISLWDDVAGFTGGSKPPEPFFFRANSRDCINFYHTNLVPEIYELDDFQVRTPTDILGQHIHLVKFDVMASDGGANGFNYEDGTLSPGEVEHRIAAINAKGGIFDPTIGAKKVLTIKNHPYFGVPGAQTTVQRWYADPTLNMTGNDRTLRTVFTHDHFGPSTHQQVGLYAGLVVEPTGSTWYHNETGVQLGTRHDGGPTTWQAVIEGEKAEEVYREFMFEFSDFQLAYMEGSPTEPHDVWGYADPARAINPPGRHEYWDDLLTTKPWVYEKPAIGGPCPGGVAPPCPEAISAQDPGTFVVNYRNEPVALRVYDPSTGGQAAGLAGDLSHVYRSNVTRANPNFNVQPSTVPILNEDVRGGDPFTPLLRAYEDDNVQIRILVGGHEEEHNFTVHGVRWPFEIADPNSGFRGSQMMGISEHFEFGIPSLPHNTQGSTADFLWKASTSVDGQWNGLWGLLRSYKGNRADLRTTSLNSDGQAPPLGAPGDYNGVCPKDAPVVSYDVSAVASWQVLPDQTLTYNTRDTSLDQCTDTSTPGSPSYTCSPSGDSGPLHDPTAMLFVMSSDLINNPPQSPTPYSLAATAPIEPLILRVPAGSCLEVTLRNRLPDEAKDLRGYNLLPNIIDRFNANQIVPSTDVGLHTQLLTYDVTRSDGVNAGYNPVQTVSPGHFTTYQWYAGQIAHTSVGSTTFTAIPTELGSVNLTSSDPIKHSNKGLIGGLIVEPEGSTWTTDPGTRASAGVFKSGNTSRDPDFREFVLLYQDDVNLRYKDGSPVYPTKVMEDPTETGQDGANYRTEPAWFRKGYLPQTDVNVTRQFTDLDDTFSNAVTAGLDPETPVFDARVGQQVRFRMLHPGGHGQNNTFAIHGHTWQEEPYTANSTVLGNRPVSEWRGAQHGHGPSNHFDVMVRNGAGGLFGVTGDYLWRDYVPWYLANGIWGIFRVHPVGTTIPVAQTNGETLP